MANTATGVEKANEKEQKDKIGIDDIGIFEFIFYGLPETLELEGIDEDRLRELQNAIQEQLHQRDEEKVPLGQSNKIALAPMSSVVC